MCIRDRRTMDCTGEITLPEGTEMVMPGDNVEITVELIYPVALNVGSLSYFYHDRNSRLTRMSQ